MTKETQNKKNLNFETGVKNFRAKKYPAAYKSFMQAAKAGYTDAYDFLYIMYLVG
jgi:TPR repeat protein